MIAENRLAATRLTDEGPLVIPEEFLVMRDGALAPLPALRGTITTLIDGGFSQGEAIAWLLNEEAELGEAPLTALKSGRIHAVRRVAGMLAF
ncbi:DNA-binding protein [Arcanobacterium haemolyticum]|nr:DNA-binding protein [Arcanobacterium haemolyticum]